MMDALLQDIRYALRTLRRSPGFTTVALLTLAIGIGANTAIFTIISALFNRPLPFADPGRLAAIVKHFKPTDAGQIYIDPPSFVAWTADTGVFQGAALIAGGSANFSTTEQPEHVEGNQISVGTFGLLGIQPALGRGFLSDDATPGRDHVVILSDGLWRRGFAADPHVLGQQVRLDGVPYSVIGVMPPGFAFPYQAEFWTPRAFDPSEGRGNNWVNGLVRLHEGVTVAQANAYLEVVSRRLERQYPTSNTGVGASIAPLRRLLFRGADPGDFRPTFLLMLGAVGFVLLIACSNLAGLLLTRASTRQHEIAIREALGASRRRLIQQLLTESGLVAAGGGALGLLVTMWTLGLFESAVGQNFDLPYWLAFTIDARALVFTVIMSLGTGMAVGALPALRATRRDVRGALQEGGQGSGARGGARASRLRGSFVIAEVALAMVLLVGAGLLIRTVVGLGRVDPGFDAAHALTARLPFGGPRYSAARARGAFLNDLARRLEALPGVQAVGAANLLPLGTINWEGARIEGRDDSSRTTLVSTVAGHYLRAMGIPLLQGRDFTASETELGEPVAIINETMAHRYWPRQSALGRRIRFGTDASWRTIVGIFRDAKQGSLQAAVRDQVYIPYGQQYSWSTMSLIARTASDPLQVVGMARAELARLDPNLPLYDVQSLETVVRRSYWDRRLYRSMFSVFASVALFLAAIGIYGVIAYAVAQRTHEIGVRVALGATRRDVMRLVVGQGLGLALAGVGVGALGAIGITRLLASLLYGVGPLDPVSFGGMAVVLAGVALLASYLPARRAARVDPMVALRNE
jgi:putative ABC transport system permease protein